MSDLRRYIGDAVYVKVDDWNRVVLTTEDGYRATNEIIMESEVLAAFIDWTRELIQIKGGP